MANKTGKKQGGKGKTTVSKKTADKINSAKKTTTKKTTAVKKTTPVRKTATVKSPRVLVRMLRIRKSPLLRRLQIFRNLKP